MMHPLHPGEIAGAVTGVLENPAEAEPMRNCGQGTVRCTCNSDTLAENPLQPYEVPR
jgi:hypothetical protein